MPPYTFGRRSALFVSLVFLLPVLYPFLLPHAHGEPAEFDSIYIQGDGDLVPENGVTSGNGTPEDPFVIEGLHIDGPDTTSIEIRDTSKHLLIKDILITNESGARSGIKLLWDHNVTIRNVTAAGLTSCLVVNGCTNVVVQDCSFDWGGVSVSDTDGFELSGSDLVGTYQFDVGYGVQLGDSTNCTIRECNITGSGRAAINALYSWDLAIVDNEVHDAMRYGIKVSCHDVRGRNIEIARNLIDVCIYGIEISKLDDVVVADNIVRDNRGSCLIIWDCGGCTITGNTFSNNSIELTAHEIEYAVMDFRDNTLKGLPIVYWLGERGRRVPKDASQVFLVNCEDCSIVDFSANYTNRAIGVYNSSGIRVVDYTMDWCGVGIYMDRCEGCVIEGGDLSHTSLDLRLCPSLTVRRNTFDSASRTMELSKCDGILISDNSFSGGWYSIRDDNDSPGGYLPRERYTIVNNTFIDCDWPIDLYGFSLSWSNISNNLAINISKGIRQFGTADNCTIANNVISDCRYEGIHLDDFKDGNIHNNTIVNASIGLDCSVVIDSAIEDNVISRCREVGCHLQGVGNRFLRNELALCEDAGLLVWGSGNLIHHNNFVSNDNGSLSPFDSQAFNWGEPVNDWDNGSEGNYWDDYLERYPEATNDGTVWDTPYEVETRNDGPSSFDRYPLVYGIDREPPRADAGEDMQVLEGAMARLDGSGSTDDQGIVRYQWSVLYEGLLRTQSGPVFMFVFDSPGIYTVTLNVIDHSGKWDVDTVLVTVLDNRPPVSEAGEDLVVDQFTNATLDGSGSTDTGTISSYCWTVEMGGSFHERDGVKALLRCDHAGVFTVTLVVTDSAGHSSTDTVELTVRDKEPPVVVIEGPQEVLEGRLFALFGTNSSDNVGISSYEWSYRLNGTDRTVVGSYLELTLHEIGELVIGLEVTDLAGNGATGLFTVEVRDGTPPIAKVTSPVEVAQGVPLPFYGGECSDNVGIVNYTWTFEDEGTTHILHGLSATHTFAVPGEYLVDLRVEDGVGLEDETTFQVVVLDTKSPIGVVGEDVRVRKGTTLLLDGSNSTDNVGITSYSWLVSRGEKTVTLDGVTVQYTFDRTGRYFVQLTVSDASGNSDIKAFHVEVFEEDEGSPYLVWVGVGVMALILALVVLMWYLKSRVHDG